MNNKKRTNEEYINELALVQPDVEVLEAYINAITPIKHRCKIHNKIYPQRPRKALANQCGCKECKDIKMRKKYDQRKTNDDFIKEMKNIWDDEIVPLEEYKGCDKKIKFLHNTEIIHTFTTTPSTITSKRGRGCPVCAGKQVCIGYNDIATTNPYIASLFVNKEDTHKYTQYSSKNIDFKCDCCGIPVGKKSINNVVRDNGVKCINCNDGISYPNKFIYNCLKQIENQLQYLDREINFDWCEFDFRNAKRHGRYDIYFETNNKKYIVEMDGGLGHGIETIFDITKEEALYIDNQKDFLANQHGIEVIRIDCHYATSNRYEYIKNNILQSKLSDILDLSYINFNKCDIESCKSLLAEACNLWNNGLTSKEIQKKLNLSQTTIRSYLKNGTNNGLCIGYSVKASVDRSIGRKVINLNDRKIFDTIVSASKYYNISISIISNCCKRQVSFGGYYNGEKQIFMYYDEYIKLTEEEIKNYIPKENKCYKKVVCLNTLEVFGKMENAAKWCGLKYSHDIGNCCRGKRKHAGKHPVTGEPLRWMYYEDYIKLYGELNLEELVS